MKYKRGFTKKALHKDSKSRSESEAFQNWYVKVLTSTLVLLLHQNDGFMAC